MRPVKATPRHDAHDDAAANSSRVSGVLSLSLATSCHRNDDDPEGGRRRAITMVGLNS